MKAFWGVAVSCLLMGSMGCQDVEPACGEYPLSGEQRQCVVETIETMVDAHYPFAEYKGVDLKEFSDALWAAVESDKDDADFLADVNFALRKLEDGHTRMERRTLMEPATAPVELELDDEMVRIRAVDDDQWRHLLGAEVVAIDGVEATDALSSLQGWTEATVGGEVAFSGPDLALVGDVGTVVELTLGDGDTVRMQRRIAHDVPMVRRYGSNNDIGYLRVDTFGYIDDLERLDEALNQVMDTRALMIDLRGNGGGFPSVSDGLFGRLIDDDVPPFRLVDVDGFTSRELKVKQRGEPYQGQVVVLTNHRTYSASNYFVHRMLYHERGVTIGERTGGGAAAPKRGVKLLPGVWFQVSSHVVRTPEGDHAESGLMPTISVETGQALSEENSTTLATTGDPIVTRALEYLGGIE